MIDTINGATSSAIIYSIVETAKANNLKPYDYFEHLLTEIPKHEEDTSTDFLKALLRGRKHCRSISGNLLKELTNKDGQKNDHSYLSRYLCSTAYFQGALANTIIEHELI